VPVSITGQPQSQTNIAGTTASFGVGASGTPSPAYQWQFNGASLVGATGAGLVLSNVQLTNAGNYAVVVSNAAGSVTSAVASLTVLGPPSITAEPASQSVVTRSYQTCMNIACAQVVFAAAASGTPPLVYQWQFKGASLADNSRITGSTANTLVIAGAQASDAGDYTLVVSNAGGSVTSAVASLTVTVPLIQDPNLEDAVRSALSNSSAALICSDLRLLTNLYAFDSHVADLSGLECATNLRTLYLGGDYISDLTPLRNLTRLETLFLYNNHGLLTDLSPLSGLTNLTYLDVRCNPAIVTFTNLARLKNLSTLYLGGDSIGDPGFLTNLTRLAFLDLDNVGINDLSSLAPLQNLTGLDLSYDPVEDFAQLSPFTKLTSFYMSGGSVTNLAFLQNLTSLTVLSMYSNSIADLSPLSGLVNLASLNLGANPITNY
jgi:hypothetical protein